ncbi:phosphotransferase enzyme family protein [Salidesulfovibrio onnuriiensis]|uniref:phosphotransferase enzyme family protein n=1 Tax=Salidesulfovibrio onnuriiensis TaxID=2583823 RepID=UPI00202B9C33|nr:phosphotransferase [Salidesulfovibrio onnuriiensis]
MEDGFRTVLKMWEIDSDRLRSDIFVPGSSERCVQRHVVEDGDGSFWVLERLFPSQHERRERIGRALSVLRDAGLPVLYYRPGPDGGFVVRENNYHWQLAPYVPGDPLPQPDFVDHPERGEALADFLIALRREGAGIREFDQEPDFDLPAYADELMDTLGTRKPELHRELAPIREALAPLFEAWGDLPRCLCHGDFHPLNVIWKGMDVAAVIDWEFAGQRPVLYDAANCLGCVGIEDPQALGNGLAPAMLGKMHGAGLLDEVSFGFLPHLLLGLRFAWMSEWLRRKDAEMQELELDYMTLLARNLESLGRMWRSRMT